MGDSGARSRTPPGRDPDDEGSGRISPLLDCLISQEAVRQFWSVLPASPHTALLLRAGRYPTAASLAILCIEEVGKVSILRNLAVAGSDDELKDCWRQYRSHRKKNVMGGIVEHVALGARKLDDFLALFNKDAEHPVLLDQLKQVGLYTDCLGEAHWSEPVEVVDERLATQLVRIAEVLARTKEVTTKEIELWVKHLGPVWNRDAGWTRKALENWYDEMQSCDLAPVGANAMRQFIREGVSNDKSGED